MGNDAKQTTYAAGSLREQLPEIEDVHAHAGLVADPERRKLLSYLATVHGDEIEETEIYKDIVRTEATDSMTDAVEAGNVSQMQFAQGMVNNTRSASDPDEPMWMRSQLLSEAYVGFVFGGMNSGKTDFALDRADDWHMATRGSIATNVKSAADRNPQVRYVASYEDLEEFFRETPTHALMLLDETSQGLTGVGEDNQRAVALGSTLKLVRKGPDVDGNYRVVLLLGQTIKDIGKDLRRLVKATGHFWRKPSKKVVEVYDDLVTGEPDNRKPIRKIKDLHRTRLKFDSNDENVEFDMSGALGDADDGEGLTGWQQDVRASVRAVALQELTYRQAATLTDYEKDWVGERYREWRDEGEHREAVGLEPSDVEEPPTAAD